MKCRYCGIGLKSGFDGVKSYSSDLDVDYQILTSEQRNKCCTSCDHKMLEIKLTEGRNAVTQWVYKMKDKRGLPTDEVKIKSTDYWFKVLGMLSQNWALIDEQEGGKFKVLFINDHSNIFDELEFDSEDEAIEGLKRNDFERYADDKESQKFIPSPRPPFILDEIMKEPMYSSGKHWK